MHTKNKASEPYVPTLTPAETYPDHVPLPLGDGRCMYRFPSGSRCRQSASQIHPYLCDSHLHHALEMNADFSSPEQVNGAMGKIFDALLHRRISAREAGTLCYIAQTILNGQRTVSFIEKNKLPRVRTLINDLPMAIRD